MDFEGPVEYPPPDPMPIPRDLEEQMVMIRNGPRPWGLTNNELALLVDWFRK